MKCTGNAHLSNDKIKNQKKQKNIKQNKQKNYKCEEQ